MAAPLGRRGRVVDFETIGTWKKVDVDPSVFADENFAGFSGIEELTDFDHQKLDTALHGPKKKLKKKKGKTKQRPIERETAALQTSHPVVTDHPPRQLRKKKTGREIYRELMERRGQRSQQLQQSGPGKEPGKDMSAWNDLPVPGPVLQALSDLGFTKPTPIQAQCLGPAINDRSDIVGGAETGSGKTLAFGIPLLDMVMKAREGNLPTPRKAPTSGQPNVEDSDPVAALTDTSENSGVDVDGESTDEVMSEDRLSLDEDDEPLMEPGGAAVPSDDSEGLSALILTPTRELAVQVRNHICAAAKYTAVKVAVVVGGMSAEKQSRILRQKPEIVVGTPGRIWEFYQQGNSHLKTLPRIQTLVIDEADRMVERRHFEELTEILAILNSSPHKPDRQTLLFSATLALVHSGPVRKIINWQQRSQQQILGTLMDRIGIKADARIVDLTQKEGTVSTLMESKIFCSVDQKDYYLYYFLLQYPGRTLVFCNSIDCIRRLQSVLTVLKRTPYPLHSSMHQKQRLKNLDSLGHSIDCIRRLQSILTVLKRTPYYPLPSAMHQKQRLTNLDRFTENPNGLLLATDVASRGLDIPNVQHVIHYQVPRTTEIYIHRSGRTARQAKQGLSLLLICSNEISFYRRVCKTLDKEEIVTFPVDHRYLKEVSARVDLAREIDVLTHRFEKKKVKNDWFEQAARDLEVDLDDGMVLENLGDPHEQKMHRHKIQQLKDEMNFLLKKKIFPSGHSQVYITSSGSLLTPMLKDQGGQQDAVTRLQNDKHFKKDRKKAQARQQTRKRDAEELGAPDGEEGGKKPKKRNRNKYHHLGKKGDVKTVKSVL